MKTLLTLLLSCLLGIGIATTQEAWDNSTRALYILDIAKYVEYDDRIQSHADFKIGVLGTNAEFYWELYEMAKTRQFIQNKPIKVYQYPGLDNIEKCHMLYVNIDEGFKMKQVFERTKGNNTLIISEGYQFNESMLNFVVVDNKPKLQFLMLKKRFKFDDCGGHYLYFRRFVANDFYNCSVPEDYLDQMLTSYREMKGNLASYKDKYKMDYWLWGPNEKKWSMVKPEQFKDWRLVWQNDWYQVYKL